MINIEHVKSLVESGIGMGSFSGGYEEYEGAVLEGAFSEDMCTSISEELDECVVDLHEFTAGASAMIIESALDPMADNQRLEVLSEASLAGVKERVVNFFEKLAKFFKTLAVKIASYFLAFFNMSKKWLKLNKERINKITSSDAKRKMQPWSMGMLKKLDNSNFKTEGFDQLKGIYGEAGKGAGYAGEKDSIEKEVLKNFASDLESVGKMKEWIRKSIGMAEKPSEIKVIEHKDDFLAVIEGAADLGKSLSKAAKSAADKAKAESKAWSSAAKDFKKDSKKDDDANADLAKTAKLTMQCWNVAQKAFTKYASLVQQITKKASKDCMGALNSLISATGVWKEKKDKKD